MACIREKKRRCMKKSSAMQRGGRRPARLGCGDRWCDKDLEIPAHRLRAGMIRGREG